MGEEMNSTLELDASVRFPILLVFHNEIIHC